MTGIRGGRIIDPVSGKDFIGDLILENGTIKAVGEQLNLDGCEDIIEAQAWRLRRAWWMCMCISAIRVLPIKKISKPERRQRRQAVLRP